MGGALVLRLSGQAYCLPAGVSSAGEIQEYVLGRFALCREQYWMQQAGDAVCLRLRLLGGKGGFGSQLRAQGNRMSSKKRAGNYEACRDLSGRRLRTINEEKLLDEYMRKKPELDARRDAEIRDKMEKAISATNQKPIFRDVDFLQTTRDVVDEVEMAVNEALYGFLGDEEDGTAEATAYGKQRL